MPRASATVGRWGDGPGRDRAREPSLRTCAAVRRVRERGGAASGDPHAGSLSGVAVGCRRFRHRIPFRPPDGDPPSRATHAADDARRAALAARGSADHPPSARLGLVTVVSTVTQLWHFADFAELWMRFAGIDAEFTNIAQGDLWGRIGAGILILGWLATALLSGWMIARSRLAWWIPLVGAILTYAVLTVCLMVPLANDPAIAAHLVR